MNIVIIVDDTKGESKEIKVLTSDTISICKKKYKAAGGINNNEKWKYDGRVINDETITLEQLGVENEDHFILSSNIIGGNKI
jgi:hypothetical protein